MNKENFCIFYNLPMLVPVIDRNLPIVKFYTLHSSFEEMGVFLQLLYSLTFIHQTALVTGLTVILN